MRDTELFLIGTHAWAGGFRTVCGVMVDGKPVRV